jgi:hypothetical protein
MNVNPTELYLDLMGACLLGLIYEDPAQDPWSPKNFDREKRELGRDWPLQAHSMIGRARLRHLRAAVLHVLNSNIPGDFIETGVWRGGACIYMRAILKALGVTDRRVWAADSFEGLPEPDPERYPADTGDAHHTFYQLIVSLDEVKENFAKYGLLDDQVRFLPGWFKDTLPRAEIDRLAILRLDGDMYESTMDAIIALYDRVSPRGIVIVDDYGAVPACRQAIDDFRAKRGDQCADPADRWHGRLLDQGRALTVKKPDDAYGNPCATGKPRRRESASAPRVSRPQAESRSANRRW